MQTYEKIIELTDVNFAYSHGTTVLEGICLTVNRGDRAGIIGANGSGKTTLFHLIMGLLKPISGSIHIFGQDVREEKDFYTVRRRIGLLFQNPGDQLFCPTVLEDVAFGPLNLGRSAAEAKSIAQKTLTALGIADFGHRISHKLSHGEKKLVALAGILAMDPEVLILDEPTAGLDQATKSRLIEIIDHLGLTLVIASHDMDFLSKMAGVFYNLKGGRIGGSKTTITPARSGCMTCPGPL